MEKTIAKYKLSSGIELNVRIVDQGDSNYLTPLHEGYGKAFWGAFMEDGYDDIEHAALEANLADAVSRLAYKNHLSSSTVQNLYPAILRLLKSNSPWSK